MSSLQPPCNLGFTDATTCQSFRNSSRGLQGLELTHLILEVVLYLISTACLSQANPGKSPWLGWAPRAPVGSHCSLMIPNPLHLPCFSGGFALLAVKSHEQGYCKRREASTNHLNLAPGRGWSRGPNSVAYTTVRTALAGDLKNV